MPHDPSDFSWAVPVMRIGYAGRGLTYLVIAGYSLWAIWQGGQAEGTATALSRLETTPFGNVVLALIALGLAAYAVWRVVDAIWDLEDYGTDAKGIIARLGQTVTGLIHLAIGAAAAAILFGSGGSGQGSAIARAAARVMEMPYGRWIVGLAGAATVGAGIYYGLKALRQSYRRHLRGNRFTQAWNPVLRAGLLAQGVVVGVIGAFLIYAGLTSNPGQAGGLERAFGWLEAQVYGQVLVSLLCLGLVGFALFCFVNAAYRVVPKAEDEGVTTLARRMKAEAERAAG